MKLLTRKEALARCRDHWLWTAKTGKIKSKYPFEDVIPSSSCYACEYDEQNDHNFCLEDCIIPWPGGSCAAKESPFYAYCREGANSRERKEAALYIAALCEKALNKLR
jgi:hypothetical protein